MLPALDDLDWLVGSAPVPEGRIRSAIERAGAIALALAAWQILGWTAGRIRAASGEVRGGASTLAVLDAAETAVRLHVELQERLLERLAAALDREGIPFVLLKGSALRRSAWPEPGMRASWDIDVGVPRHALADTEAVVRALGFAPAVRERPSGRFVPAPRLFRAILESYNHELCAMVREQEVVDLRPEEVAAIELSMPALGRLIWDHRGGRIIARTGVDIHHMIDPQLGLGALLASARRLGGMPVPNRCWAVVHAARTLHRQAAREGARLLHALGDLARLLPPEPAARLALAAELRAATPLPPIPELAARLEAGPPDLGAILRACTRPDATPRLASSTES